MDVNLNMVAAEQARVQAQITSFNRALGNGRVPTQELGKDDFLQILMTQLQNQDPTSPMEDKEFIAQMAQFSSLEQMTSMTSELGRLTSLLASGQAAGLLGKTVELMDNGVSIHGIVNAVTSGDYPQVRIGDSYYDFDQIETILE